MKRGIIETRVYKMGPKLGLYLNKKTFESLKLKKGDVINILIKSDNQEDNFLSKLNSLITLKRKTIDKLNLSNNGAVGLKIEKVPIALRSKSLFSSRNIDLLYLIPSKSYIGANIYVSEFKHNRESWLRIWSCHNRGSCKEIRLKRFLNIGKFGKFLGLMQSEGSKNKPLVEFCNRSIQEHIDFLDYLKEMGISKNQIIGKFDYHYKIRDTAKIIDLFERKTRIKIKYTSANSTGGRGYGFKLIVRNSTLSDIVYNSLKQVMSEILYSESKEINLLRDSFFSKLLNGDGSIELITKNRITPQIRLKICDGNENYLKDYKSLMELYGLKPHIYLKENFVRSYISIQFVRELIKMDAFKNNPNYDKLLKYLELVETNSLPKYS